MTAVWTLVLVALVALAYLGMWRGWRGRVRRTGFAVPEVPVPPRDSDRGRQLVEAEGVYVSTTTAGDWLDRVAAHGLGNRGLARLQVHEQGLLVHREPEQPLWVGADEVRGVRDERAQAGKVRPGGGIVLVTWQRGESRLDTGFAPRRETDPAPLLDAIATLPRKEPQW